jgi:hypothetical protein
MASLERESLDICYSNLIQTSLMRTMLGFVPNFASGTHVSYDRTEPQIGAFVALQIFNKWGDGWVIDVIFDSLLAWNSWVWNLRRGEGSLVGPDGRADLIVLGSDPNLAPGGTVGGANDLQAARYESGLDNSPMYDGDDHCGSGGPVCFDPNSTHHMNLYDVGMTALFLSDTQALMTLAAARGRSEVLPLLQSRYDSISAGLAAHMWNSQDQLYSNVLYNGSFYPRYSPTTFYPLISGQASVEQAEAMMATASSPLGFCMNTSYTPDPSAAMLVQWWDGKHDNAACLTDDCTLDIVNAAYSFVEIEAVALLPEGASAGTPGAVPLHLWHSAARGDYALTNSSAPPDQQGGYVYVRQEGWCWTEPPTASSGLPWATTPLTLWFSAARQDYQTCGSPHCLQNTAQGYVPLGTLCYAFSGTGSENLPCKFGGNSISRGDAAFLDNNYWRGRSESRA